MDGPLHVRVDLDTVLAGKGVRGMTEHPRTGEGAWLAVGDFDVDGYADVLLPVWDEARGAGSVVLLRNVACGDAAQHAAGARTFQLQTEGTGALEGVGEDVRGAGWAHVRPAGGPDVLLNTAGGVRALLNGFLQDALFFRTEVLGGAARPYGAAVPGPAVKLAFTDAEGALRVRGSAQCAQLGYGAALTLPFAFTGLGRTSSFVELLSVRTPARAASTRAGLVPNADLVIRPGAPFHYELLVRPARYFLWVLLTVAVAMAVLAGLTALFKWRECREDERARRRALHAINFDAL